MRTVGEKAARQALEAGACAADLSSLHLLGLLEDDDRLRIRSALPSLTVARSAIDDSLLTRDHVRNLSAATYTASLAPDGTIDRTAITTTEQALLRTRAEALETITAAAQARRPSAPVAAAADTIAVARENQLLLWCDDIALRQKAPHRGRRDVQLARPHHRASSRRDRLQPAGDLPAPRRPVRGRPAVERRRHHRAGRRRRLAARPRPHGARPAGLVAPPRAGELPGSRSPTQARSHSADALTTITKAALTGALQHVSPGYVTQRYQQIAVLAVIACHDAGQPTPPGLLYELARGADPARVPQPPYVLAAVTSALSERGVPNPEETAMRLLPGTSLP